MKMPVLSIFDSLIGYGTPFCEVNCDVAKRAFDNSICRLVDGDFASDNDPCDLTLYHIGDFDSDTGELFKKDPELISRGSSVVVAYKTKGGDSVDDTL